MLANDIKYCFICTFAQLDAAISFKANKILSAHDPPPNRWLDVIADGGDQGEHRITWSSQKDYWERGFLSRKKFWPQRNCRSSCDLFLCGTRNNRLGSGTAALHLLALYPEWQDRLATTAVALWDDFSSISRLNQARAVFYEALCLYLPVGL